MESLKDDLKNSLVFCQQLENINQYTSAEQKKSIHFKSLKNFIYHYSHLKKSKITVADLLHEYLLVIETAEFTFTEEQSKGSYDLYISPLARIYVRQLNFSSQFSILFNIIFYGLPNMTLWLIFRSKILLLSLLLVFSLLVKLWNKIF